MPERVANIAENAASSSVIRSRLQILGRRTSRITSQESRGITIWLAQHLLVSYHPYVVAALSVPVFDQPASTVPCCSSHLGVPLTRPIEQHLGDYQPTRRRSPKYELTRTILSHQYNRPRIILGSGSRSLTSPSINSYFKLCSMYYRKKKSWTDFLSYDIPLEILTKCLQFCVVVDIVDGCKLQCILYLFSSRAKVG